MHLSARAIPPLAAVLLLAAAPLAQAKLARFRPAGGTTP